MTVFERIKFLANKRGKSLNEVEEELSLSKNVLYRMKNSDNPTKDRLETLADYFNVSVDYLLGRTDNPSGNLDENIDNSSLFFRIDASDMSEEDKMILREDLDDFLALRKKRLIERNAKKDEGK